MLSLPDRASVERAIATAEGCLADLLASRLAVSIKNGVADLTHYLVVRADDHEGAIVTAVGFSPLINPFDQARFPDPAFHPWWDWLGDVGSWFEMIVAVGDTGFAFILLIEDDPDCESGLMRLCRTFARPSCQHPLPSD